MEILKKINDEIKRRVCNNALCKGHVGNNLVLSKIAIIGLAPSYFGDLIRPFTGKDRKIFDKILKYLNLSRNEVFITNVIKCCLPSFYVRRFDNKLYLFWRDILSEELEVVNPRIVILFGRRTSKLFDLGVKAKIYRVDHPASFFYQDQYSEDEWISKTYSSLKINLLSRLNIF
jgi:uracil-DNA glycosylase family 4